MYYPISFPLWVACVLMCFLTSCTHEAFQTPNENSPCYDYVVQPILSSNCAFSGCHDASKQAADINLTTYDNTKKVDANELLKVLNSGQMPPRNYPALTENQKNLLIQWVKEGEYKNMNCNQIPCDSGAFSFKQVIQPFIENNCRSCHSGTGISYVLLTNYTNIRMSALSGKLLASITHNPTAFPMPPSGEKVSDCHIAQIRKWIELDAPDN